MGRSTDFSLPFSRRNFLTRSKPSCHDPFIKKNSITSKAFLKLGMVMSASNYGYTIYDPPKNGTINIPRRKNHEEYLY